MSLEIEFYFSNLSWSSLRIKEFLNRSGVKYKGVLSEFGRPLPFSIYGELPVLKHGETVIEDHRLILMYVDEVFASHRLLGSSHNMRVAQLEMIEKLDSSSLPMLVAPVLLDPELFIPRYMAELGALRKNPAYKFWRKSRARNLALRHSPYCDPAKLHAQFQDAVKQLSEYVNTDPSSAVAACIISALEMLRGENAWWKKVIENKDLLAWMAQSSNSLQSSEELSLPRSAQHRS